MSARDTWCTRMCIRCENCAVDTADQETQARGWYARAAAFVASGTLAVAYFRMHFPAGFWPVVNGGESAVLYCFAFLLFVFHGPGALRFSRR